MAFLEEYTLLDELGQGGYATVYKVRHNKLGYIRAIRVLNAIIAHGESDKVYQKFLDECRLLLRLGNGNHPNIVHIYQPLLRAQRAIVEMDYVDGKDLFHYLEEKSTFIEIADVLKLLTDIGSALAYCHEDIYKFCMDKEEDDLKDDPNDGSKVLLDIATCNRLINKYRVIHNDIHFGNIIRRENGNYVLLDFGLAIEGESVVRSSRRKNGAPEFKAPEKWDNDTILSTQSDIYSFGVVLYGFLAGRVPFPFDKRNSNIEAEYLLSKAHREKQPEPIYELRKVSFEKSHPGKIYQKDYPEWLEYLIMKCLAKNPKDRFKNGKELFSYVQDHMSIGSYSEVLKLKEENEKLHKVIEETNTSKDKIDELVLNLQTQLKNSIDIQKSLSAKNEALRKENEELKYLSKSQASGQNHTSQIQELKEQLADSQRQLHEMSQKMSAATDEISSLRRYNQELDSESDMSTHQIWKKVAWVLGIVVVILGGWIINLYNTNGNSDSQIVAIPVGDTNLFMSIDTIDVKSAQEIIEERNSLQEELNMIRNSNPQSVETQNLISSLKTQVQEKEDRINSLTASVHTLNTEITRLKSNNGRKVDQRAVTEQNEVITQLQSQIKNLNNTIIKKDEEIKVLQNQLFN